MQILISIIFIIYSNTTLAVTSDLTCSKKGLDVFFINGVLIDDKAFKDEFSVQAEAFFDKLDMNRVDLNRSYPPETIKKHNHTEGILRDIAESYFLYLARDESKQKLPLKTTLRLLLMSLMNKNAKLDEYCSLNKALEVCEELKKIIYDKQNSQAAADLGVFKDEAYKSLIERGRKLIFITHSGGNLMADRVRDFIRLQLPPEYYGLTGHVSLARPYFTLHENVETIVFEEDGVIESLRIAGQNTPAGNVSLQEKCDNFRFLPWFNHGFDCYLGNNPVQQSLYDIPGLVPSVEIAKAAVYKVASRLANNDENCCNKGNGKVWINDDNTIGGFLSGEVKVESGKVTILKGAQICGSGTINATNDPTKHVFGEQVVINGKINFNSKFKINGTTKSSTSSILITEEGTDVQMFNVNLNGELYFKKPAVTAPNIDPWIISATVTGKNEIIGPVRITQSNFLKDLKISSSFMPLVIQNLKMNSAGSLNLTNNRNDQSTTLNDITVEAPLNVSSKLIELSGAKFYGSTTASAPENVRLSGEYRGTSVLSAGNFVSLNGKFKSISGSCDDRIFLQGQISDSLKISDCDFITGGVTSNGPLDMRGSYNLGVSFLGGGTIIGSKSSVNNLTANVSGTTNITAPNGFRMGGGFGGSQYIVIGNVSYTSSATCESGLFVDGPYSGDISASLNSSANTSYCSGALNECNTWGTCESKLGLPKKPKTI